MSSTPLQSPLYLLAFNVLIILHFSSYERTCNINWSVHANTCVYSVLITVAVLHLEGVSLRSTVAKAKIT